jgi:hypothetical protein
MSIRNLTIAAALVFSAGAVSAAEHPFAFSAAYNWGQALDSGNAVTYTRAGNVVGSWQWRFADGRKGNTHFSAQSFYRSQPNLLVGTITFNMFEMESSAAGSDELYMTYDATSFDADTGSVSVSGRIVGGKGRYAGASGSAHWVSTNGFIDRGEGTMVLPDAQ